MCDRLVELMRAADKLCSERDTCEGCVGYGKGKDCVNYLKADYLLANGVSVSPIPKTYESLVHGASFAFGGKCGENFVFGKSIEKGK